MEKENFLDYVPKRNEDYCWGIKENGNVEILMENAGFWNRIFQKLLKKPVHTRIDLEEQGSCLWKEMDGTKTIYELADLQRERFGEGAEPVYERVSIYVRMLKGRGYIYYVNKTCPRRPQNRKK